MCAACYPLPLPAAVPWPAGEVSRICAEDQRGQLLLCMQGLVSLPLVAAALVPQCLRANGGAGVTPGACGLLFE